MSTTQPIEDICRAHLAGYHYGQLVRPRVTASDMEAFAKAKYANEELATAFRLGLEEGQKPAATNAAIQRRARSLRLLFLDSYRDGHLAAKNPVGTDEEKSVKDERFVSIATPEGHGATTPAPDPSTQEPANA